MFTIHHPVSLIGYFCLGVLGLALARVLLAPEHFAMFAHLMASLLLACATFCLGRLRTLREDAELKAMADAAERRAAADEQERKEHAAGCARLEALCDDPRTRLDAFVVFMRETKHLIPRVASVLSLPKVNDIVAKIQAHATQPTVLGMDRDAVAKVIKAVGTRDDGKTTCAS
jgi:hypothetical protein